MLAYTKLNGLRFGALLTLTAVGLMASCNNNDNDTSSPTTTAKADIVNTAGQPIGTATFSENTPGQVSMVVSVTGIPAGEHGIHFHMVGKAEPGTAFMSAGEHYNPDNKQHGLSNPNGAHNGDLPNLVVNAQGVGRLEHTTDRVTLATGSKTVFDADGTALVIHTNADDQRTDPSGNSGGRIAAGVVTRTN